MPLTGCVDEISRSRVLGWAMDTDRSTTLLSVTVRVDGRLYGQCEAGLFRPGLREHLGGEASGHHQFVMEFDPPLSVFRPHHIEVLVDGYDDPLMGNTVTLTTPVLPAAALTPLIVTSTGRSGTTLLMSELAGHPQIVVADRYPFEIKLLAYYASAYRTLVSNEDRIRSTSPDTMFVDLDRYRIGHNPYNTPGLYSIVKNASAMADLFERTIPQRYAELFRRTVEDYYETIRNDRVRPRARLFAEKGDLDPAAREGARMLFGAVKEVVLVRDPRDLLCSAKGFWKISAQEAIDTLSGTLVRLEQIRLEAAPDTLFLRYEDLIAQPETTRRILCGFLGVELQAWPEGKTVAPAGHATSADPTASIGRWKTDLTADEIARCHTLFGTSIAAFGYEPGVARLPNGAVAMPRVSAIQGEAAIAALERGEGVASARESALTQVLDVSFGTVSPRVAPGPGSPAGAVTLLDGWSAVESSFVWSCAKTVSLHVAWPAGMRVQRLWLVGTPYVALPELREQHVGITVDGVVLGNVGLSRYGVIICELATSIAAVQNHCTIVLSLPDARRPRDVEANHDDDRLLGFSLARVLAYGVLDPTTTTSGAVASLQNLMLRFESLGPNCEFGLVQRRCGAEPLGLLRFASAPLLVLLAALRMRFQGMGEPASLRVELSSNGREYMVRDLRFGFLYHAWVEAGAQTPEEVHAREVNRIPFLVRKLVEDLEAGEKIFVYHAKGTSQLGEPRQLADALRIYGSTTLLWIERAAGEHFAGSVHSAGKGLIKGYIESLAPEENAHDFALKPWAAICRTAYNLTSDASIRL